MFAEERQERIYQIVTQRTSVKVSELSSELDISEVTIRRDLDELQRQKRIIRTHGGAMSAYSVGREIVFRELITKEADLKRQIARAAYGMINDYDTLLLDTSSTVNELVKFIANGEKRNLRVITTSLLALRTLAGSKNCTVQIVGGDVNYALETIEGSVANRFIREIRVDKSFIGINGIDERFGFSTPRYADADIKIQMLQSAHCGIVLSDHTKLGKTYLARVDAPDYLITDRPLPEFNYDRLGVGVTTIFAGQSPQEDAKKHD